MNILDDEAKEKVAVETFQKTAPARGCEQGWEYRWCTEEKSNLRKVTPIRPVFMQSPTSTNSRGGSRHPQTHPTRIFPYAQPQPEALLSPAFSQSPSMDPPLPFPTPFSTAQYDFPSQSTYATHPPGLSPPNWQITRATSSYSLESSTLAFPEPQLHRATSARASSRPPPPPPRTPRQETDLRTTPAPSHRNSGTGLKTQGAEVALRFYLERHLLMHF